MVRPLPFSRPALLGLLLLGVAGCATSRAGQGPSSRAFLWEVTRPEAPERPLYLTGSVHVGQPGQFTLPPAMEAAFARAGVLVVELDAEALSPQRMQGLIQRLGLLPPREGLTTVLSEETRERLPAALQKLALPPEALERMQPWLASITLSLLELRQAGFDEKDGVDLLLLARARGKKRILELETAEEQLTPLARLPVKVQDLMLRDQLARTGEGAAFVAEMARAWSEGDVKAVERLALEHAGEPDFAPLFEALFYARNRRMAEEMAGLVTRPEVAFVVVGAGHLVGPQGVLALLEARGLKVRQLLRGE